MVLSTAHSDEKKSCYHNFIHPSSAAPARTGIVECEAVTDQSPTADGQFGTVYLGHFQGALLDHLLESKNHRLNGLFDANLFDEGHCVVHVREVVMQSRVVACFH